MFVTVFYGIYNLRTGELTYTNAGHNPPYILKSDGQVVETPMPEDPIVGAFDFLEYHQATLQLDKGDMLIMFTDGVNEAMNTQLEEYGDKRFMNVLKQSANKDCQEVIKAVKADLSAFTTGAEQSDDITMLAIKRL
jgi:sigma-B regulation protein RsbU (phosphoserine phosphatase)